VQDPYSEQGTSSPSDFNTPDSDEVIDLSYYWSLIRRHLWKVISLSAICTVIAALVVLVMTPVYTATSTLLIESKEAKVVSIEEVYGLPGANSEYFQTQFEILRSRDLAREVVRAYSLTDEPEFNPFHENAERGFSLRDLLKGEPTEPPSDERIFEATVYRFWKTVTVTPIRNTQLVDVSVESESPLLARELADAVCKEYIRSKLREKIGVTKEASSFLQERLGSLKTQLAESERKLQAYRDEHGLVDLAGVDTLVTQEIDQITRQLVQARTRRLELESTYRRLQAMDEYSMQSLAALPAIVSHPVVVSLRNKETEAELRISELSKRYGEMHPKMIAARSELASVEDSLLVQMKRIAESFENDFETALDKEKSLVQAMDVAKSQAESINENQFELTSLIREVEANRQLYDLFFTRINETAATGDLELPSARIVDPAVAPGSPSKPNKKFVLAVVVFFSLMLGVTLVLLIDLLDATIKNPDEVDRKLATYLLGVLPLMGGRRNRRKGAEPEMLVRAFAENTEHGFTESVRTIRTSLTLASMQVPAKVMLVTSSVPFEGKTTLSCNLSEAFGQVEKTLLIDADMRRPSVAKKLGLTPHAPGLSNAVVAPESLEECIQPVDDLGIDVMSSGPIPPNPLELLGSESFRSLLATLSSRYDRIIIDSAPVHAVSDAVYLSTLVDGVVYVVKADATKDSLVKKGLERMKQNQARILGVVLNQVDVERERKYTGSYAGYYDTYGYTHTNNKLN
tara:strand:+ start:33739 stop:35973 length:2235 start_codon:yes stop_codon:yes gene_type:complete